MFLHENLVCFIMLFCMYVSVAKISKADLQKTLKVYPVDFNSHILEASKSVISRVPGGAELRREVERH